MHSNESGQTYQLCYQDYPVRCQQLFMKDVGTRIPCITKNLHCNNIGRLCNTICRAADCSANSRASAVIRNRTHKPRTRSECHDHENPDSG